MKYCLSSSHTLPEVLLLGKDEIVKLLSMGEALKAVERCFKLEAQGKVLASPKVYLNLPRYRGDFRAMPAYIDGIAGIKWVSAYPYQQGHRLPTVIATIILSDPKTGCPLAIIDGTYITSMRTGAAGGVAVKYLARPDSATIGMIGAGVQAETQLLAISEVLPKIEEVKVFDIVRDTSLRFTEKMRVKLNINVCPVKRIEEAAEVDILVTSTPSRKPIAKKQWIRPGTHINAIGADAEGKQELDASILGVAKVVVDNMEQASESGEINVPLSEGKIKVGEIYGTLGEVVAGMKKGRQSDQEITIFDSTGLAIQDIICAKLVYEKASGAELAGLRFPIC